MPNIKPISDLRSYNAVLEEVSSGSPVFLTRNGRGRYAIMDISDYERYEAEAMLLGQLEKGMLSIREHGTATTEQLRERLASHIARETV